MSDNSAEALAQAFVKKTEILVQKRIAETALRGLLGAGMQVFEITDWVKDFLAVVKNEAKEKAINDASRKSTGKRKSGVEAVDNSIKASAAKKVKFWAKADGWDSDSKSDW